MLSKAVLILALSTVVVGCWGRGVSIPIPDLNAAGFALMDGDAIVEGSGFIRVPNGERVFCAGSAVWLVPNTPYFQWASNQPRDRIANAMRNSEAIAYVRTETCDVDGRFTFTNVPAGEYLAGTIITWETPFRLSVLSGTAIMGGEMFIPVAVEAATTQTITITR